MVKVVNKRENSTAWYILAATRVLLGFVFLWAFFDKTFGLGFATASDKAWIAGGSPTTGFLKMGVNPDSPFAAFFNGLAGMAWVDWLFMAGLFGIGLALVLGVALRLAAVAGSILLGLMWLAVLPLENNPVVDEHIVYLATLWVVAAGQRRWSLATWWLSLGYVKKHQWLW